jgi:hypothetical protein
MFIKDDDGIGIVAAHGHGLILERPRPVTPQPVITPQSTESGASAVPL